MVEKSLTKCPNLAHMCIYVCTCACACICTKLSFPDSILANAYLTCNGRWNRLHSSENYKASVYVCICTLHYSYWLHLNFPLHLGQPQKCQPRQADRVRVEVFTSWPDQMCMEDHIKGFMYTVDDVTHNV